MKIIPEYRTVVIEDEDLSDAKCADWCSVELLAVMLHPEDSGKVYQFLLGMKRDIMSEHCSEEDKSNLFDNDHDFAKECALDDRGEAFKILEKTLHSRKSGLTGSLVVRGCITGHLLGIMAKPNVNGLNDTYRIYIERFDTQYGISRPSEPLLKKIWQEFKYVSHFWAAYAVYKEEFDKVLFSNVKNSDPKDKSAQKRLYKFLRIVSFFQSKLIESSCNNPSFDTEKVWQAETTGQKPIPPLQLILQKKSL